SISDVGYVSYIQDSYTAYGNDGNHFNDSINAPPNTAVGQEIADAIHYASDHIPLFASFTFEQMQTITVLIPNGGEYWVIGNTYQVEWTSENIDFVKMFITTDNGSSWELFAENVTASDGSYDFVVPIITSDQCKIKIVDESNDLIFDESDSLFSIGCCPMPEITVISPNGGEHWYILTIQDIIWSNVNVENVKIELSLTDGMSWETIVDSIPSTGLYSWFINTSISSFDCLIRISDVTDENVFDVSDDVFTLDLFASVEDYFGDGIPTEYNLIQNFPNPFNPSTTIYYSIPELTNVVLKVYDVLGNEVSILVNKVKPIGNYEVKFNSTSLPSGIYFYKLQAGSFVETKKMVLMK
ncbi:MAG: T9SS type A sorting domain-containing protein, partial [Ignavibacteria bacterium]|nr:T9SS type A sorting domain-containing protein [Ignavibacteria bacterium]